MSSAAQKPQINTTLEHHLMIVVGRERLRRVLAFLAVAWIGVAIAAAIVLFINRSAATSIDAFVPNAWMWLGLGAVTVTFVAIVLAMLTGKSVDQIAHRIESDFPDLDSVLITAMEQRNTKGQPLGFLQQDVIRRAVYHAYRNDWKAIIPSWQIICSSGAALAGLVGLAIGGVTLLFIERPPANPSIHTFNEVKVATAPVYRASIVPGNTEIERGTSLLVLAQFEPDVPPKAALSFTTADGTEKNVAMTKSLDDPVFAGRMSQVKEPVTYRVMFDDQTSEEFIVTVFDFPGLVRSDADLAFPEFTKLPEKQLQDVRRISAVVGTEVTLKFFVNKPLESATLTRDGDDGGEVALSQSSTDPLLWETKFTIEQTQKYRLALTDDKGRQNNSPPGITINALENQPPNLKLVEPTRDVQVSAIEEINLQATAWDDFGLERIGVSYSIGGEPADDLVLSNAVSGKEKHPVEYLLALEKLNAVPDQLIAWHFWAEDFGPDGQLRRTSSDMFFAEVRRFEEIYRQAQGGMEQSGQQGGEGQGQGQGGGQNAERAMELAELQKEIINATWRVIRRETKIAPTDEFQSDMDLLIESQESAKTQVDEFAAGLQDNQSLALAEMLKSIMSQAVTSLNEAKSLDSPKPLNDAIRHEQSAYQTLLKMRAREYQVQRANQSQQQQQQQRSSQSQQQQQMQQMQLKDQADRYEQERLAQDQEQQTQEQQENRQILSRLRELAQRQNDLNKRIQELKSALEEAESEAEKEEIEKQLKRLQEEQQQILRDADELQERMQQPENQERMSEQSQQLDQARQNVQQASEALKEGDVSRAATEGTRAERELKELQDEFQKRTSGQFTEQMRQMRNQAQDLEQEQKALEEQLAEREKRADERSNSLTAEDDRPKIAEKMGEGQQAVEDLRDQIKRTIEEAEEYEPLLADELYDTYRNSERSRPDQALESARRSLQQGFTDDAQAQQQRAVEGIGELREGIEKAAESVLGDEAEALKVARNTLEQLSRQLDQELQREQPDAEQNPDEPGVPQPGQQSGQQSGQQPGERQNQQPGENQQQGQQPGQQPGERQGEQQGQQTGEQPGRGNGQQPEQPPAEGQQPDQPGQQQGQQPGQGQQRQQPGQQRGGNRLTDDPNRDRNGNPNGDPNGNPWSGNPNLRMDGPIDDREWAPIAGDDFREWSDRLRDVEEMINDPDLRAEAARIRDRAKEIRKDVQRHSAEPNWDLVKMEVAVPLVELQKSVTRELLRRDTKNSLIPLNREPVPTKYERAVQKYYEQLGTGK